MAEGFAATFAQINQILGICPCCGEIFRLADARPYIKGKKVRSIVDDLNDEARRVDRAEEKLAEQESSLREASRTRGLRKAKSLLKKIDPVFSGHGIDPQDVKVIFEPVNYVIFDGLNGDGVTRLIFSSRLPKTRDEETLHQSLTAVIKKGDVAFETLRVLNDGTLDAH